MRILIQRVREASVTIDAQLYSSIGRGLLVLVGIEDADTEEDVAWLCGKLLKLRIFDDEAGVMNCSAEDVGADIFIACLDPQRQSSFLHSCCPSRKGYSAL